MLRVLHIISDTNIGGAGRHLLTFLEHYDRARLAVWVLCPPASLLLAPCAEAGVETLTSRYLAGDRSFSGRGIAGLTRELRAVVKKYRIDIVHTHASFSGRLAAKAAGVRRIVYTKHRMDWEAPRGLLKKQALALLNNFTYHRVIAVSQAVKGDLLHSGVPEDRIALIYNGIDVKRFREQARRGAPDPRLKNGKKRRIVGIVGRLEPEKGHRFFLEAAAAILKQRKDVFFIVVGTGSLAGELAGLARHLGISEHVLFTGYQDNIAAFIAMMDVLVIPSLTEAFGIVMLEAMCLAKPCVASAVGGLVEIAGGDGRTALLIPPGDAAAIAAKVNFLLERPDLIKAMGLRAVREVEEKFTAEKMTGKTTKLYYELLKS
ncbi:MAG: glycosyltransferase family 4 protein [Desulfotomaculaceae bacterium]|nr:glycosyltransferase family 4 protein [Desulfotomaculaceae bacterium]